MGGPPYVPSGDFAAEGSARVHRLWPGQCATLLPRVAAARGLFGQGALDFYAEAGGEDWFLEPGPAPGGASQPERPKAAGERSESHRLQ